MHLKYARHGIKSHHQETNKEKECLVPLKTPFSLCIPHVFSAETYRNTGLEWINFAQVKRAPKNRKESRARKEFGEENRSKEDLSHGCLNCTLALSHLAIGKS